MLTDPSSLWKTRLMNEQNHWSGAFGMLSPPRISQELVLWYGGAIMLTAAAAMASVPIG